MGPFGKSESGPERRITRSAVWRMRKGETIWDTDLHGFGVEASEDGKVYFLASGIGGERKHYVIGRHGEPWMPETARAEAWRMKSELMRTADTGGGGSSGRRTRRLTGSMVEAMRPKDIAWDSEVKGFGVRCQRVSKVYFLKTRVGGRQRWITIGKHGPELPPEKARQEALRLRTQIATGTGPAADNLSRRNLTVRELCDLYLKEGCKAKRQSTIATDHGRIERHIKPLLGDYRVAAVTAEDIGRFAAEVSAGKTAVDVRTGPRGRAIVTGGAGTAARTLGLLGGIFSFAVAEGICRTNPVRGAKRTATRATARTLTAGELARLGVTLSTAARDGVGPAAVTALRLVVATGCRAGDVLQLTWDRVDLERASIELPEAPPGQHFADQRFMALSMPALRLLRALPQPTDRPPEQALVLSADGERPLRGLPRLWRELREKAGLEDVRLQDLTHCFAAHGPQAIERFLAAEPPAPQAEAPLAEAPLADTPLAEGPTADGAPAEDPFPEAPPPAAEMPCSLPRPYVATAPSATPTAELLAWHAAAQGLGGGLGEGLGEGVAVGRTRTASL